MVLSDTLKYEVENGWAKFTLEGIRQSTVREVYQGRANSLAGAIVGLMDYQFSCLLASLEGRTASYVGAGSDRGQWEDRHLACWELDPNSPLLDDERKLVQGIVSMHNRIVSTETKK